MGAWYDIDLYMRVLERHGPARLLDAATYDFDDEPRADRQSRRVRERIAQGYRQVVAKNAAAPRRLKQEMLLQLYSEFYGLYPSASELAEFFSYGFDLRNVLFLCKALVPRRRVRR